MTRIWTGTATVVSGYTTVTIESGDPLTDANCPADATIVLGGRTYFVAERTGSAAVELTRAAEEDGIVTAEIDPMTAVTSAVTSLALQLTDYEVRLALLDAYGKGLFYTILGQTGANDPGPGKIGRDAATWADVTALYFDVLDAGGFDATPLIDQWDISTIITVRSLATRGYASFRMLTAPADQSGAWRLLGNVEYLGGDGSLADSEDVAVEWNRVGTQGKFSGTEVIKTAAYTALAADVGKTIILNKATADTLSFDAAATLGSTWMIMVKNIGAGAWSLDPNGAETIDGSATVSLAQNQSVVVSCNGTALRTILSSRAREKLLANRTYYVRTDGSNSNDGLANTSGGAFLTLQKAADVVFGTLDLGGFNVTIQVGNGTYTAGVSQVSPQVGAGSITFQGNTTTPGSCIVSTTSANCFEGVGAGVQLIINGFKLQTTTSGNCINVADGAKIQLLANLDFGTCATRQVVTTRGGIITVDTGYAISGGAAAHFWAEQAGIIFSNADTFVLSNTPAFSTAFAAVKTGGNLRCTGTTFSGTGATGVRATAGSNGVIDTNGGGASYFPGNSANTTATGGQIV